jgi:hypothetical protein
VSSMVCSEGRFIGSEGRGAGASDMGSAWWSPACFRGHSGSGAAWACLEVLW